MSRPSALPVEEYLRGAPLSKALHAGQPFPLAESLGLVALLLSELATAHGRGLVHGDLKPDNLLLCERADGTRCLKVLNFGTMGRSMDAGADVQAAGRLLCLLLTGRDTVEAPDSVARFTAEPIPLELERVVARALGNDASARFRTAEEFRAALLEINEAQQRPSGWLQTSTFDVSVLRRSELDGVTTRSLEPRVLAPRLERRFYRDGSVANPSLVPIAIARGLFLLSLLIAYAGTLAAFVLLGRWLIWKG